MLLSTEVNSIPEKKVANGIQLGPIALSFHIVDKSYNTLYRSYYSKRQVN